MANYENLFFTTFLSAEISYQEGIKNLDLFSYIAVVLVVALNFLFWQIMKINFSLLSCLRKLATNFCSYAPWKSKVSQFLFEVCDHATEISNVASLMFLVQNTAGLVISMFENVSLGMLSSSNFK